ncbi:recombinase family protein [Asaia sp. HN010]|uniref:recombinase family protein n=1 Tax=Asaia sp. HN010 TaxID=3081233 RepID=UPI00301AE4B9
MVRFCRLSAGVGVKILNLGVDTNKASGRLFLTMLAGFAEFEREIIRERCLAGLASARSRGITLGRRCSLTKHQKEHARGLKAQGLSANEVAKVLNTSKMTAWRAMNSVS